MLLHSSASAWYYRLVFQHHAVAAARQFRNEEIFHTVLVVPSIHIHGRLQSRLQREKKTVLWI